MSNKVINKRGIIKQPIVLHCEAGRTDIFNREGYRMVISCNHDNSKTGSKAQTSTRS